MDGLDGVFLEQRDSFDWHPGMMLEPAHLQVPFMADLVTLADPTSPYSFLNFLKQTGRLYRFYIRENFYPLRAEYNQYCQWVAGQLRSVRFSTAVLDVTYDAGVYRLSVEGPDGPEVLLARRLVLGTGTSPYVPASCDGIVDAAANGGGGLVLHNADYLSRKSELQAKRSITIVGSGQSAAEIYYELLQDIDTYGYQLNWVTRSGRFFPLEYTKLTLEMTSPEYVDYFHGLPQDQRDGLIKSQKNLYKGINSELIDAIYDLLYTKSLSGMVDTQLLTHSSLTGAAWDAGRRAPTPCSSGTRNRAPTTRWTARPWSWPPATPTGSRASWPASRTGSPGTPPAGSPWHATTAPASNPAKSSSRTPSCTRTALSPRTWAWPPTATRASCARSPAARSTRWSAASRSSSSARRQAARMLPAAGPGPGSSHPESGGAGMSFTFRCVDAVADAPLLHSWVTQPYAAVLGHAVRHR